MSQRYFAPVMAAMAIVVLAAAPAAGQAQATDSGSAEAAWTMPRTADGHPDLQGFWTTQTFTPLQRPEHLGDKEFFTEEEAAELNQQLTAEGVDPLAGNVINLAEEEREQRLFQENRENRDPSYVHYDNQIWLRTPVPKGLSTRRTSLITDPPNGRMPPLTAEAEARRAAEREARRQPGAFDGHERRPLSERCIVWPHNGPPMLPPAYNDIHQILQTPDQVAVFTELTNNSPRIIPLDGGPHISERIRQFPGDSRARWEGDTLVVETRGFNDKTRFQGSTGALHVVERFTRAADATIRYEVTVDDPTTWATPWTAAVRLKRQDANIYEFACHEGNGDMLSILATARAYGPRGAAAFEEPRTR